MLYRNYPRDFRYQMFNIRLPRGGNCFICRGTTSTGLAGLPSGGHLVVAPYVDRPSRRRRPRDGLGTPLGERAGAKADGGLDVKWMPTASTAVDATINPDFSQIESDVAQIAANERFALFFPEKRPFFLEGIELFATPIQAVYTRTITSPRWGVRATGKSAPPPTRRSSPRTTAAAASSCPAPTAPTSPTRTSGRSSASGAAAARPRARRS